MGAPKPRRSRCGTPSDGLYGGARHSFRNECLQDSAAVGRVNWIAVLAERAQHHPDIIIRWNKVSLSLVTHDAGGITTHDFDLAQQIEQL